MDRILFITNRNILTTCGELRLIKNRAEVLYEEYGIATDFIAWNSKNRIRSNKREQINAGGTISTLELNMMNLFQVAGSYRTLKRMARNKILSENYNGVIVSGTGMPSLVKWLKKEFPIKVYIDVHGAFEDIMEVAKRNKLTKRILFHLLYQIDKKASVNGIQNCDGVFVVTEALSAYLKKMYNTKKEIDYFIIPCATDTCLLDPDEYKSDRAKYRGKYEISSNDVVFVYSGGVSSWQCVQESIELYRNISKRICRPTKMLIFSHDVDAVSKLVNNSRNIIIDSYSPIELGHALKAGDFAFLLRKDNITNNVAFPNKFLEYVQSGMRIITTPYVYEIAKQVQEFNLGYIWDFNDEINGLINYVNEMHKNPDKNKVIENVLVFNSFNKTLNKFVESLRSE